jgi:hypothetical protein
VRERLTHTPLAGIESVIEAANFAETDCFIGVGKRHRRKENDEKRRKRQSIIEANRTEENEK